MKRKIIIILSLALSIVLPASAARLMVVSDLHYLARELYEGSDLFIRALRAGDGKYVQHGEALMAALRAEVRQQAPDALIVTGDLTFNGEKASHEALAEWFNQIEADGTPVWVIPGNHDINVPAARGFDGDGWYYTDPVDEAGFSAIYADFTRPATAGANLSYAVRINDDLWVAMTDVSYYRDAAQTFGLFTAGHAEWLEEVAQQAAGAELVTATHHSLIQHTAFSAESYLMFGHESMAAVAQKYGVRLNLSGHLHVQHVARADGLTDAALGAFCAWPHRYALVTLEDGALTYEAKSLDEAFLPENFLEESRQWYLDIARDKTEAALPDLDPAERRPMADFAARFNLAYFSGAYDPADPAWRQDPGYALWQKHSDSLFWQYMDMVMNEPNGENLYVHWERRITP